MAHDLANLESTAIFDEWSQLRAETKRSLGRAKDLHRAIGLDAVLPTMSILGVVGSKGKGTAAIYASAALAAAGHKVGTVTSPGVISNRDRVRIDGAVLPDDRYQKMLQQVLDARSSLVPPDAGSGYLSPSGLFMAGGLRAMADAGCEVAVVEAGIGGLSDELSLLSLKGLVVTQIFNEHADVLGPTIADIARDKVGVVKRTTRFVVSLPQSDTVTAVIQRKCEKCSIDLVWIDDRSVAPVGIPYPPGLSRANAAAGVRAGSLLSEITIGTSPSTERLKKVMSTVRYPGRLSTHALGQCRVIVDSAISRDGLATALVYAKSQFRRVPPTVYLSVPANKDFEGFVQELEGVDADRVFVNMPDSHLPFPQRDQWPWRWIDLDDLESELGKAGDSLLVGTATFSAHALQLLGADSSSVFDLG